MADFTDIIDASARRYNVDPKLVNAVIQTESSGKPGAINTAGGGKGAYGPMQVRQAALADYNAANGTKYGMQDLLNPRIGVDVGTWYLGQQLDKFNDPNKALVAYNEGAASKNVETGATPYVQKVMSQMAQPKKAALPGIPQGGDDIPDAFSQQYGYLLEGNKSGAAPAASKPSATVAKGGDIPDYFSQQYGYLTGNDAGGKPSGGANPAAAAQGQVTREWAQKNPAEFQKMLEAGKISPEQWQAITGSTGSIGAGIRDVVSGVVQRGAHTLGYLANAVAPNSDLAKTLNAGTPQLDTQIAKQEQAYQAARQARGETGADIGRAVTGAAPMVAIGGGPVNGLGGLIAQGAQLGAVQGLMTPVTSGNYGEESIKNVGLNAAVGGAVPVALQGAYGAGKYIGNVGKSLVAPFTEKGQNEIAAKVVNQFASKGAPVQSSNELVKGSAPILAESTGNAGIGALTRGLASANPEFGNQLAMRTAENNAARVNALQNIAGDAERRSAAEAARDQAVKPLYDVATSQVAAVDSTLKSLMSRPSMKMAIERAKSLAGEAGRPFSLGKNLSRPSIAGEGTPKAQIAEVTGNDLQTLKMAMDDMLSNPQSGIVGKEADAIRSTRNELVNWMESKIPEFQAARETYAQMSKPIAQMDVANRLLQKYSTATTDLAGVPKLQANAYLRALEDESRLLKNSGAFKGYRGLKDVFTPEQLATIKGVGQDLNRAAVGQNAGKPVGANTFQNISTNNLLQAAVPGRLGQIMANTSPGAVGGAVGGALGFMAHGLPGAAVGAMAGSRVGNITNRLMATQNDAIQARIANMLLQNQMPVSPAAAAVMRLHPSLGYLSPALIGTSRQSVEQSP